jgi:tRNA threonylcarbamoyl adenosine modification protein YjeE
VPSPTFTLVQTYATPRLNVAHVDLYRISDPREIDETGLFDLIANGAALVEWPERAGDMLPETRLDLRLSMAGDGRRADIAGGGDWATRLSPLIPKARA